MIRLVMWMTDREHESDWRWTRLAAAGIDCAACAAKLRQRLLSLPGVRDADIAADTGTVQVIHRCPTGEITAAIDDAGYRVTSVPPDPVTVFRRHRLRAAAALILFATALTAQVAGVGAVIGPVLLTGAIAAGGLPVLYAAVRSVRRLNLDMNVLISVAAIGAIVIGHPYEAGALVSLYALGRTLETWAAVRAQREMKVLWRTSPDTACVRRTGTEQTVPAAGVDIGDTVILRPGDRAAVDGLITEGSAVVDLAPISGESRPVHRSEGDRLYAGSRVYDGYLELIADTTAFLTTPARVRHLIDRARMHPTGRQTAIERFSRIYTPAVLAGAVLAFLAGLALGASPAAAAYRALALLVIACPCSLVVAAPIVATSALTTAARHGLVLARGAILEAVARVDTVALDKTGTITTGRILVTGVTGGNDMGPEEVLRLAALVEQRSAHPLARAILDRAREEGIALDGGVSNFRVLAGRGVSADVDGRTVYVGSHRLFSHLIDRPPARAETIYIGTDTELLGSVRFSDELRPGAKELVQFLTDSGIRVLMVTGDDRETAEQTAESAGIREVHAELEPDRKLALIDDLSSAGPTMMIGDGVNDAPALARATVGVAVGSTAVALDSADVTVLDSDPGRIVGLFRLARAASRRINTGIMLAVATKLLAFLAVVPGWLSLVLAILADDGALLLVTLNGLSLLRFNPMTHRKAG